MRKAMALLLVLAFMLCGVAFAEQTGPADYDNDLGKLGNKLRACTTDHDHEYVDTNTDTQRNPEVELGAGIDLVVFEKEEAEDESILAKATPSVLTVETKWDFANENGSAYVVATYKLADLFK